jgi:hypothetical protein
MDRVYLEKSVEIRLTFQIFIYCCQLRSDYQDFFYTQRVHLMFRKHSLGPHQR